MSDYPNLWKRGLIQRNVRNRANHQCEQCGMEFHQGTNLAVTDRNRKGNPTVGTVHHIDMDKQNCSIANLVYLCQRCHLSVHFLKWLPGKPIPKRWQNNLPIWTVKRGLIPVLYDRQLL